MTVISNNEVLYRGPINSAPKYLFAVNIHPTGWSGVTKLMLSKQEIRDIDLREGKVHYWDAFGEHDYPIFIHGNNIFTIYKRNEYFAVFNTRSEANSFQDGIDTYKDRLSKALEFVTLNGKKL